jgi:hypothetical protein
MDDLNIDKNLDFGKKRLKQNTDLKVGLTKTAFFWHRKSQLLS